MTEAKKGWSHLTEGDGYAFRAKANWLLGRDQQALADAEAALAKGRPYYYALAVSRLGGDEAGKLCTCAQTVAESCSTELSGLGTCAINGTVPCTPVRCRSKLSAFAFAKL